MGAKNTTGEIAAAPGLTQKQTNYLLEIIVKVMVAHLRSSQGEGIEIKGLGSFEFVAFESFGLVNVVTGERKLDDVLFRYHKRLKFHPGRQLRNKLDLAGLLLRFHPVDEFNSKDIIGTLTRSAQDEPE